jgi:uncharacterized repeat protein (TIGR04052 family)
MQANTLRLLRTHGWICIMLSAAAVVACGGGGGDVYRTTQTTSDAAVQGGLPASNPTNPTGSQSVTLRFAALSAGQPIQCGQDIPNLGSTGVKARLTDFRFYVSEVRLLKSDGSTVPLQIINDGLWQYVDASGDSVALLDLEDGSDSCSTEGNAEMRSIVTGTVPAGAYTGVQMVLGVPVALNHSSTAKAAAPLDIQATAWSWQTGRKFAKIEVSEPVVGAWKSATFYVHLGSTGCTGNAQLGTVKCSTPNRGLITLSRFDPSTQTIGIDLSELLKNTNITINQGGAGGCMSAGTDADCLHVMDALAIDWKSDGTGTGLPLGGDLTQRVFKAITP